MKQLKVFSISILFILVLLMICAAFKGCIGIPTVISNSNNNGAIRIVRM